MDIRQVMDIRRGATLAPAVPWAVALVAVAAVVGGLVLRGSHAPLAARAGELYLADIWVATILPPLGAYLLTRTRARPLGLVLLSTAVMGLGYAAAMGALYLSLEGRDGAVVAAASWLPAWSWTPYLLLIVVVPLLLPDGRPASATWSTVARIGAATVGALAVLAAFSPGPIEPYSDLRNPLGVGAAEWIPSVGETLVVSTVIVFLLVGVAGLAWRWRASRADDRRRMAGLLLAAIVMASSVLGAGALPYPWLDVAPALGITVLVVTLVGCVVGTERSERRRSAARDRTVTREAERCRLHRDLHDGIGPELAGLALHLRAIGSTLEDTATRDRLLAAEESLRRTVEEVRRIVEELRPPALDQLGLGAALAQRAAELSASSQVEFAVEADPDPESGPAAIEVAAYRIACEAMTNVVRHADARRCRVSVDRPEGAVVVYVADDGRGHLHGAPGGVGLASMQVRAEELGGRFRRSAGLDGSGSGITAVLPLEGAQ